MKMAEKPIHSSMAMTADIHPQTDGTPRLDSESRGSQVVQKQPSMETLPKKKTFKITSVKKSDQRSGSGDLLDGDGDSLDDLDESHTEDASSDILDVSKGTEYDLDNTSETGTAYNLTPDDTVNKEIVKDEKLTVVSSTQTSATTTVTTEATPGSQQSRFKVVKIETKEPFRRGRWMCYDFLDTPANVHVDKSETKPESRGSDGTHSGNSSAASSVHYVHGVDDPSKNPLLAANLQSLISLGENQLGQALGQLAEGFQPVGQPIGQLPEGFQPVQSISKQQGTNVDQTGVVRRDSGNTLVNMNQTQSSGIVTQPLGQSNHVNIPQTLGNQHIPQNITNLVNSAQTMTIQSSNAMQQPGGSQQPVYNSSNQSTYLQNVALAAGGVMSHIPPHSVSTNGHSNVVTNVHEHKRESSVTADGPKSTQTSVASAVNYSSQQDINKADSSRPDSLHVNDTGVLTAGQLLTPLAAVVGATGAPSKYTKDDSSPLQRPQEIKPERNQHGNIVNQSGSSTVAIDNKIEQAMDLVKSHLMYAVREEVEVLKAQIKELIEKNDQLLYENSILRAAASQETLSKLSQPRPQSSTTTS